MVLNLKIIGYYEHENFGDEQYKSSFSKLFKTYLHEQYTLDFYDCDKIKSIEFQESDIIILGGGDVLNNYFLNNIITKFKKTNNKIIAVSVGIPYVQCLIETDNLNIIDYIFLRTTVDIDLFRKYFDKDRVFYLPDISYILTFNTDRKRLQLENIYNIQNLHDLHDAHKYNLDKTTLEVTKNNKLKEYIFKLKNIRLDNKKIVCFALSRHIFNKNYINEYNLIIKNLTDFIVYLVKKNYHILFINFNNNILNSNENDSIISLDVINNLFNVVSMDDITFIDNILYYDDIFKLFNIIDLCIPMRFHAVLFSIYCNVPVIPIYTTRKIDNLLSEINWDISYKLPTNNIDIPINLDTQFLIDQYIKLQKISYKFKQNIYHKLLHINMYKFHNCFYRQIKQFINKLIEPKSKSFYISTIQILINKTYNAVEEFSKSQGYTDYRSITDPNLQNIIVSIISYNLLDSSINTNYNYGLKEKIFNTNIEYDYNKEWRWMLNDHINSKMLLKNNQMKNYNINDNFNLINIKYIDQIDYSGCHRSGWQYVYNYLEMLHNDSNDLLVDLYLDRTFHWNYDINKILKIIPYTKSWFGFIHHTFDKTFSQYNCHNLLKCPEFIESLKVCKGLIVLSKYLKTQLELELKSLNIHVNIYVLIHPTDFNVIKFSYPKFCKNKNKNIIHVGGWLRNIYSFYNLILPKTTTFKYGFLLGDNINIPFELIKQPLKKIALKGKNMSNYYPEKKLLPNLYTILNNNYIDDNTNDNTNNIQTNSKNINIDNTNTIIVKRNKKNNRSHHNHHHHHQNCSTNNPRSLSLSINLQQNCSSNNLEQNCSSNNLQQNCSTNFIIDLQDNTNIIQFDKLNSDYSIKTGITNNWNKHFYEDIIKKINNVESITFLENDSYDKLLSENIVFINLVDASAINTVIECIIRTTPIIVNNHPAVVELLGTSYPLYYNNDEDDNIVQIYNLLKTDSAIRKAHKYLKRLNKKKYKIETFIKNFIEIININQ